MSAHRLKIEEIDSVQAIYTRWIESVQVIGENQDVYVTFSPRFKRIWMQVSAVESKPATKGRIKTSHFFD
jgi:hypothetical protein